MTTQARPLPSSGCRIGIMGAIGTLVGIVLSGPFAVALVSMTHPQPTWQGPVQFAQHYHPMQMVPYLGGLVLVAALLALLVGVQAIAPAEVKSATTLALVLAAMFASLISINYIVQTTFLPALVRDFREEDASLLTALSMANPKSLGWALEMWGWGFLGVATWLVAGVFRGDRLERVTALTFRANGVVSAIGTAFTVARPGWVMTTAGLLAFALWNLLLATMAALSLAVFRRRRCLGSQPAPL